MELVHAAPVGPDQGDRPVTELPKTQLVRLSLYWLGLSSIFIGVSQILSGRIQFEEGGPLYTGKGTEGGTLFALTFMGAIIAALVWSSPSEIVVPKDALPATGQVDQSSSGLKVRGQ